VNGTREDQDSPAVRDPVSEFPRYRQAHSYLCFTRCDWPVLSREKGCWPYVDVVQEFPYLLWPCTPSAFWQMSIHP